MNGRKNAKQYKSDAITVKMSLVVPQLIGRILGKRGKIDEIGGRDRTHDFIH